MLDIGIVGGGIRGRMYAGALRGLDGVRVVAVAEPAASVAGPLGGDTGLPVVSSHTELLERYDPDAVVVATPDFAHRQVACDAAAAGRHLLVEKPLATTLADAQAIVAAVRTGGGSCLVGFENRWNPHVRSAWRSIQAGTVGAHVTSSATLSNSWFVPTRMLSWAAKSSPAWFLMPHTVDMLTWFSGATPQRVCAVASRGQLARRGIDTEDVVHALITYTDGTTSALTSAWTLPDGSPSIVDFRFHYVGTTGAITGTPIEQGLDVVTDRVRTQQTLIDPIGGSPVGAPVWMAREWAAALRDGHPIGPGADVGLQVTRVICALERSFRTGQPVDLQVSDG